MSQVHSRTSSIQRSPLEGIFGPNAAEWNYSEQTLREALEVKRQQEITKQEYYKAENSTRVLELLKVAIRSRFSESTIALMFNFMTVKGGIPDCGAPEGGLPKREDPFMRKPVATRRKTVSLNTIDLSVIEQANGISQFSSLRNAPPMGCFKTGKCKQPQQAIRTSKFASAFKFGGSSSHSSPLQVKIPTAPQPRKTLLSPRHQLSPARIGAHAVCSLGTENGSIKPARVSALRHGEGHLRSLSLPTNVTIPERIGSNKCGNREQLDLRRRSSKKRRFDLSGLGIKCTPDVQIREANIQVVDESGDTTIDESVNDSINDIAISQPKLS